jgi:broad specificity phosphatase PhoE
MILYFIRHGQTDWNLSGRIQGSRNCKLNETGLRQSEELGKTLSESGYAISRVYSSKQKRALKTASIVCDAIHAPLFPVSGLQEVNFGDWEGLTHLGESYQDMLERSLKAVNKIIEECREDVAVVTHGAVIMGLLSNIYNAAFDEAGKYLKGNCSVTPIDSALLTYPKGHTITCSAV